jgi:ribonucleoside-triphosphate reductase (formate)
MEQILYTNSTHLPVGFTDDIFEALKLQDDLQIKYTGGTVLHGFVGERMQGKGVKTLVRKIAERFRLPYFTITPTFSICPVDGYLEGEQETCPKCETEGKITKPEIYSRVVGYIRPIQQWNRGKRAEWKERKTFKVEQ